MWRVRQNIPNFIDVGELKEYRCETFEDFLEVQFDGRGKVKDLEFPLSFRDTGLVFQKKEESLRFCMIKEGDIEELMDLYNAWRDK